MSYAQREPVANDTLTVEQFSWISSFIHTRCGIALSADKQSMAEARLRKRVKARGLPSLAAYYEYLVTPDGQVEELDPLLDVITTNKTDFFRERRHFDFLTATVLPVLTASAGARPLQFWSAGCSSGEEPYTLAMVLSEYAATHPGVQFRVLGTDLSTDVLHRARTAVYTDAVVEPVPPALRAKYLMRSKNGDGRYRVVPELRMLVELHRLNLMDRDFGIAEPMDAIFCRNVLIYFARSTQRDLVTRLADRLRPGGYLFVGHTDSLHGMDLPLTSISPSVHVKDGRPRRLRVIPR
jgi:chemotaxis protein methyltransferase CheR